MMGNTACLHTVCLLLLAAALGAQSAPRPKPLPAPSTGLDTVAIRKAYMEGDFDQAIEDIERALKRGGRFSHQDSVFMFKHLGVMHAAKYETREKGKHYMYQLLTVEPAAKILDMYASDMIYMIFKNIQNEFEATHGRLVVDNGDSKAPPPPKEPKEPEKARRPKSRAWIGWTAGAVAAVGGAAFAFHLLDEESPKEHVPE